MYMAPIVRVEPPTAPPALRRAVGAPVVALAALIGVPWMMLVTLLALVVLAARFAVEASDYAGRLALGR